MSLVPESLKYSINLEYIKKFSIETLEEDKFVPLGTKDNIIFVGIVDVGDSEKYYAILRKVIYALRMKPKVVALSQEDFDGLIKYCKENIDVQSEEEIKQNEIKEEKKEAPKKRIGELLIDQGLITPEQLDQALAESKIAKTPIGSILVEMGFITLEQLRETLSEQQGFSYVESPELKIDPAVIGLLPEDFIKDKKVVPISTDEKTIVVGMVNPNDKQVLNDIIYLCGLKPYPLILTHIEFEKCIDNFFKTVKETEKLMKEISTDSDIQQENANLWKQVEEEMQDESNLVAKFASSIVTDGIERGASDIHIEPRNDAYIVRYRTDGILIPAIEIPKKIETQLISRIKVISRMDISEHRRPQDGNFSLKYNNKVYNLRVNTLPVGNQEKIVIRILKPNVKMSRTEKRIELAGSTKEDIDKIDRMITSPHGIILVTGPTGSGKTTTLYSILNKINNDSVNITTVEDPVEIRLDGVNQVQINSKAEITFASCMRAILRQDPDIVMIGEIRDYETLETAIHASLTGHLVLSTIHTNSATSTITRLIDMGAAPYLIASSVIGVISQRLLRKLCPHCKEQYVPSDEELGLITTHLEYYEIFKENKVNKAIGCTNCGNSGYIGRTGIYEIMPVGRDIKKMISNSTVTYEMDEVAVSCGMKTLQRAAMDAILAGQTSITEYVRVLGAVSE